MNQYLIAIIFFTIFFAIVSLIADIFSNKDSDKLKVKKHKGRSLGEESRYSTKRITNKLDSKAQEKDKYTVETMCLRAGHKMSYGEFVLLRISTAIVMSIGMFYLSKNMFLIIVFIFIGFNVPQQYMKVKANKNLIKMEKQVGAFLKIITERYKVNKDVSLSMVQSLPDFRGQDPFYMHFKDSVTDISMGKPIEEVLHNLVRITGNKYLERFAEYHKITMSLSTHQEKVDLLYQAFKQYDEDQKLKYMLREKISGPVKEAYVMIIVVPIFFIYQSVFSDGYLDFMLNETMGQLGLAGSILVVLLCIWFVNTKVGAPLD